MTGAAGIATGQTGDARQSTASSASPQKKLRHALHRVYERWEGTPYQWGGDSKSGIDCSAFVQKAVDDVAPYELPRTTRKQVKAGKQIPRADLETGDLVFFRTGPNTRHVGLYLNDGRFMHVSSSQGVTISRLNNNYWRHHYWQSRRIDDKPVQATHNL